MRNIRRIVAAIPRAWRFCVVAFATVMFAGTAKAVVIPPAGLTPGSQYQILFVTADTTDATSGSESYYNSFVQTEAAPLTAILPVGTTWDAITSTYDGANYTNAGDNVPEYPTLPVYNTQGQEVSFSPFYIWAGPLSTAVLYNQNGTEVDSQVWTGSDVRGGTGMATTGNALGQSDPTYGDSNTATMAWIDAGTASADSEYHVYGLSSPITVVPEPATIAQLGSGLLALAGAVFLRRYWARFDSRKRWPALMHTPTGFRLPAQVARRRRATLGLIARSQSLPQRGCVGPAPRLTQPRWGRDRSISCSTQGRSPMATNPGL